MITWKTGHQNGGDVFARAYYDNGTAVDDEFLVNTYTTGE